MIPSEYEYLVLLLFLFLFLVATFKEEMRRLLHLSHYWAGLALFVLFCSMIELIALDSYWWRFDPAKILGIAPLGIPLEEYIIFTGFYMLVVAGWESICK